MNVLCSITCVSQCHHPPIETFLKEFGKENLALAKGIKFNTQTAIADLESSKRLIHFLAVDF